jgi:hypothetical protein
LSSSTEPSPINWSTLAWRFTAYAVTNQDFIGITNRQQPAGADERKTCKKVALEAPNPTRRRTISFNTYGNESAGSHSRLGTEPCRFISVWSYELFLLPPGQAEEGETFNLSQQNGFLKKKIIKKTVAPKNIGLTLHCSDCIIHFYCATD